MSRPTLSSICRSCQLRLRQPRSTRPFSSTRSRPAEEPDTYQQEQAQTLDYPTPGRPAGRKGNFRGNLQSLAEGARAEASTRPGSGVSLDEPYHLNVYAHKHNIHITFTEPSRNPILSLSAGNIGLRKAQRSTFDAAYQLAAYTFRKMAEKTWRTGGKNATFNKLITINEEEVRDRGIEVVLRGYGPGREAFQKALMGTEGRIIKPFVVKVTDSTRLKFGGTRSRAVRRL